MSSTGSTRRSTRRSRRRRRRPSTWRSAGSPGPANHSRLWLGCSALLAACGGERGRRAAENGLASIALTSAVVNLVLQPLGNRRRPDRQMYDVPVTRQVAMPRSTSWPSGHSASAFAFAFGVSAAWPQAGIPLSVVASLVAYSRVHGRALPVRHDRRNGQRRGAGARGGGRPGAATLGAWLTYKARPARSLLKSSEVCDDGSLAQRGPSPDDARRYGRRE
ncbi:MAG: phosphatase PAP2 family protein [Actinomycetota bacterium]|nr:phosphatase PAP2 family protein [Actinomycetota bacterium]